MGKTQINEILCDPYFIEMACQIHRVLCQVHRDGMSDSQQCSLRLSRMNKISKGIEFLPKTFKIKFLYPCIPLLQSLEIKVKRLLL